MKTKSRINDPANRLIEIGTFIYNDCILSSHFGNHLLHIPLFRMGDPGLSDDFKATTIQSQRAIYNTTDPSESLFMSTCGQSGHPYHRHYDDMIRPYLDGEFHPARFTREEVEESAGRRRLLLIPPES